MDAPRIITSATPRMPAVRSPNVSQDKLACSPVFSSHRRAVALSGCDQFLGDFWGTKREEAVNLFKRVEDGDQLAFEALVERTKSLDPNAAMQLGFVLDRRRKVSQGGPRS